ncbi:hypothetical protein M3P05_08320 [Sansalvadorimonas sp. 2012CJ34-2]|uniref:Uncharacterized protein n=1 Tax=Parendozoicomonas callyspongiae TaxID=2942213 RepID=A0ABT0PFE3_9GAMM|nr:hypothetical protein [Sansalvadorimonas sp. 2012CJ34-2]MCL6269941.1 hypothetical protein [Sansalvadorimonas sp. 2012CJ34-2]
MKNENCFLSVYQLTRAFLLVIVTVLLSPSVLAIQTIKIAFEKGTIELKLHQDLSWKARGYSGLKPSQDGEDLKISPVGNSSKRFIDIGVGNPGSDSARGTLNVVVLAPAQQASNPGLQHTLSYLDSESLSAPDAALQDEDAITMLMEGLTLTELQEGRIGMHSGQSGTWLTEENSLQGENFTLTAPGYRVVMGFRIKDLAKDNILFRQPVIGSNEYTVVFNKSHVQGHSETGMPSSALLLVMYYEDDTQGDSKVVIHMVQGQEQPGRTSADDEDYTLNVDVRLQLAQRLPLETMRKVVREAGIEDMQIEPILFGLQSQPQSEKVYKLLELIADMKEEGNSAFYISQLLEKVGASQLAERLRKKQLEITQDDRDLQTQMRFLGRELNELAPVLAVSTNVFSNDDLEKIKVDFSPGYQLLNLAFQKNKLHDIYKSCQTLDYSVVDIQLQDPEFSILASLMQTPGKEASPESEQLKSATIIIPDDEDLNIRLHEEYTSRDFGNDFRIIEKKQFENTIRQLSAVHGINHGHGMVTEDGKRLKLTPSAHFYDFPQKPSKKQTYMTGRPCYRSHGHMVNWLNHEELPVVLRSVGINCLTSVISGTRVKPSGSLAFNYYKSWEKFDKDKGIRVGRRILRSLSDDELGRVKCEVFHELGVKCQSNSCQGFRTTKKIHENEVVISTAEFNRIDPIDIQKPLNHLLPLQIKPSK